MPSGEAIDIFGKSKYNITHPITADMVVLEWANADGSNSTLAQVTNMQVQYQQNVTRKYSIGSQQNFAVIIPGRPIGTITMGRLYVADEQDIFTKAGWSICDDQGGTIKFSLTGTVGNTGSCIPGTDIYTCTGCYVTGYSFTADADSLQVLDNITVEFLQLAHTNLNTTT